MTHSSSRSSDGKLRPSSDNLVASPIEDVGKGSEEGNSCREEERRERKNAWKDRKGL